MAAVAETTAAASKRVVEETRKLYASLLTKPLDERQLARPPFKFIQDLVKSLITEAKILRDVYTPADFDLVKRNWDRRAKVDFIQKLIDYAANNKQPVANCLASRVVSGLEANKTNELLQSLAKIALIKRSASNERRPRTFVKPPTLPVASRPTVSPRKSTPGAARVARPVASEARVRSGSGKARAASRDVPRPVNQQGSPPADTKPEVSPEKGGTRESRDVGSGKLASMAFNKLAEQDTVMVQPKQTIVQIVSETDINKNIHYLRSSLKSLRSIIGDLSKGEELLKDNLDRLRDSNATGTFL